MSNQFHPYIPDSMSSRPEFYSGRGATTSDLNSPKLEDIYQSILRLYGAAAAAQYVYMVADLPKLSATEFLIALQELDQSGWKYKPRKRKSVVSGVEVVNNGNPGDEVTNMCSIFGVLFGHNDRNETGYIRGEFLRQHAAEIPKKIQKRLDENHFASMYSDFGYRIRR